jgi:hypothetical protein
MLKRWSCALAQLIFWTVSLAPFANAQSPSRYSLPESPQSTWHSPAQWRSEYLRLLDTLSERVPASDQSAWATEMRQKISAIRQQVNELSDPMVDQISRLTDRQTVTRMVDHLAAGDRFLASTDGALGNSVPQVVIVPPDLGGAVAGTTCSTSPTSAVTIDGEKIGLYVDRGLSLAADVLCQGAPDVLGEGTNTIPCVAWGVLAAIEVGLDSLIDHQEFCNSLLDGANADATSANVINVHDDVGALDTHLTNVNNQITAEFTAADTHLTNVDTHITNVDTHIAQEFAALDAHLVLLINQLTAQISEGTALLGAGLKQVMKLELTPEGQRKLVPAILTCTGSNCPNVLASCPAAGCSWNNVGPLP